MRELLSFKKHVGLGLVWWLGIRRFTLVLRGKPVRFVLTKVKFLFLVGLNLTLAT